MERLLNITKVECIEARYLAGINIVKNTGVLLNQWRNWQELPTVGLSSLVSDTKIVDKETIFTLKLTSELCEGFSVAGRHLCYRLTTATGGKFLMGTNERPYTITNVQDNYPSEVTEKSATVLTAEYSNIYGLLAILD